jgi:glucoamylase
MDKGVEKHDETRPKHLHKAAGKPGDKPTWSSGAKTLVGTAAATQSRIWFTIGNGTINEVYFPDVDQANTRSVRFLVSDGESFFSDEQWDAEHKVEWIAPGVPGCHIESRCKAGKYTLVKDIVTDPVRDTMLLRVKFSSPHKKLRLYLLAEPQVGDQGARNDAWVGHYKGVEMLVARRKHTCFAITTTAPMLRTSCGYSGTSDGLSAVSAFEDLPEANVADDGNVVLSAELDWKAVDGEFVVSFACGLEAAEASQQARAGILQDFEKTSKLFIQQWRERQALYSDIKDLSGQQLDMYRVSTAVLETHQSKRFPGAFIASLSLPWGFARSDQDVGGYHVLWPRDMVETAMGKLASGDARSARSALFYLSCTQDDKGGWSQNMWRDGTQHWGAIQMDGMALPILLAGKIMQEDALDSYDAAPMVHGAACFLLKHGPVSQQGRWEATAGYSVYTVATEIAALLTAADFCEGENAAAKKKFLRATADAWYDALDELLYVTGTPLARKHGVRGYYVRVTPPEAIETEAIGHLRIKMPNLPAGQKMQRAINIVSPDALALVRFGLRRADDPRIVDTVKVIDATLKHQTSTGPVWVRSSKDGYGEHADGSPFDKTGIGRGWPMLAGERGHYEIAAGHHDFALEILKTMAKQTSQAGMIPEQIWDAKDIPEKYLFNGHPTGSGMPLVWAHSEYVKLLRSLHAGAIWDLPMQTVERYLTRNYTPAGFQIWTTKQRRGWLTPGNDLRVDLSGPATVEWTLDGKTHTATTSDSGFDLHTAMLPLASAPSGSEVLVKIAPLETGGELKHDSFHVRVRSQASTGA